MEIDKPLLVGACKWAHVSANVEPTQRKLSDSVKDALTACVALV